jgi:nicotinate-nucleotide pyrophosphorylase (carboxylating)
MGNEALWASVRSGAPFKRGQPVAGPMVELPIHVSLPHDRSAELWVDHKPTERLDSTIRRWVTTLMHDEGITAPLGRDSETVSARIWSRQPGRLAGIMVADHLMREWMPGATWDWMAGDGADIEAGKIILGIEGGREQVLAAERMILNIIGRLSGIATNSLAWSRAATPMRVASTRKVHWGLLDKWAVHLGGGLTHRLVRGDARMVKENDLTGIVQDGERRPKAIARVVRELNLESTGAFIVLEVATIDEAVAAAEVWVQRMGDEGGQKRLTLMLDNMEPEKAEQVILDLNTRKFRDLVIIEGSGNVGFSDLETWKNLGVDLVSASGLHRGTSPLDLSMLFEGA